MHQELQWLDIPKQVSSYKLGMLTHRCLLDKAPVLSNCCIPVAQIATCWHLCLAAHHQLTVLWHRLSTYGHRAFTVAGPMTLTLCQMICKIPLSAQQPLDNPRRHTYSLLSCNALYNSRLLVYSVLVSIVCCLRSTLLNSVKQDVWRMRVKRELVNTGSHWRLPLNRLMCV